MSVPLLHMLALMPREGVRQVWPVGVLSSWLWCDGEFIGEIAFPDGLDGLCVRDERRWGLVLSARIYG